MALAGVTGIIGTVVFTRLRKRVGLERTGLVSFNSEILCLTLCVASIWAPGSPFDPHFYSRVPVSENLTQYNNSLLLGIPESSIVGNESQRQKRDVASWSRDVGKIQDSRDVSVALLAGGGLQVVPDRNVIGYSYELALAAATASKHSMRKTRSVNPSLGSRDVTTMVTAPANLNSTGMEPEDEGEGGGINISIILFLVGIVASRVGKAIHVHHDL